MLFHAVVKGRVQGVGFRYWVMSQARRLNLSGWVKNLPDGRVEVEAEGTYDNLFEMEQLLWKGPTLSRVDDVKCEYQQTNKNYAGFIITR